MTGILESGLQRGFDHNTGTKLVLIDTGTGGKLDDSPAFRGAGHLLANLRAAGYQPDQVDVIFITHTDPDHVGGLTIRAERAFPNATVYSARSDVDVYVDARKAAATLAAASDNVQAQAWLDFQKGLFELYIKAGKFHTFDGDVNWFPASAQWRRTVTRQVTLVYRREQGSDSHRLG